MTSELCDIFDIITNYVYLKTGVGDVIKYYIKIFQKKKILNNVVLVIAA